MSLEESTLIDLIEKFTHLWNKKDPYFKDKIAIENSWKTISQIMVLTVEECQEMWKSIRLKFVRERRLLKNTPSGSGAYSCNWPLYDKLGFLQGVITTRKTKGNILKKNEMNISHPSEVWDDIMSDELTSERETETEEDETIQEVESESETPQKTTGTAKKRGTLSNITNEIENLRKEKQASKRRADVPLEQLVATCSSVGKNLNSFLRSSSTESSIGKDDYHFGLSVAESISKIKDEKRKLQLKAEIFIKLSDALD